MNNTKLIFFDFSELYKIFNELGDSLDYELTNVKDIKELDLEISKSKDYLVITKNLKINLDNQIFLKDFPLKINKILEKINIANLKNNFSKKSNKVINVSKKIRHENMYRLDHKYDLVIPIKYNFKKPIIGKGSAIFLHLTKNYNCTAGCIALNQNDFLILLKLISRKTKIKII